MCLFTHSVRTVYVRQVADRAARDIQRNSAVVQLHNAFAYASGAQADLFPPVVRDDANSLRAQSSSVRKRMSVYRPSPRGPSPMRPDDVGVSVLRAESPTDQTGATVCSALSVLSGRTPSGLVDELSAELSLASARLSGDEEPQDSTEAPFCSAADPAEILREHDAAVPVRAHAFWGQAQAPYAVPAVPVAADEPPTLCAEDVEERLFAPFTIRLRHPVEATLSDIGSRPEQLVSGDDPMQATLAREPPALVPSFANPPNHELDSSQATSDPSRGCERSAVRAGSNPQGFTPATSPSLLRARLRGRPNQPWDPTVHESAADAAPSPPLHLSYPAPVDDLIIDAIC